MLALIAGAAVLGPQDEILSAPGYLRPAPAIERSVTAAWHSHVRPAAISPDGRRFLSIHSSPLAPISRMGRPWVNLAGVQFDPAGGRSRSGNSRSDTTMAIHPIGAGAPVPIRMSEAMPASQASWSPDGSRIAFIGHAPDGDFLYVADAATGQARRACRERMNTALVDDIDWLYDGMKAAVILGPIGGASAVEAAILPLVRVATAEKESLRTHADLLSGPVEAAQFKAMALGQLAVVDLASGTVQRLGEPRMYSSLDAGPKGQGFLATVTEEPFSYLFPASQFSSRSLILKSDGSEAQELSKRLAPDAPKPKEEKKDEEEPKRALAWRPDGAGLTFLQKAKKEKDKPQLDRVMLWKAPFGKDDAEAIYSTEKEIGSLIFNPEVKGAVITRTENGQSVQAYLAEWSGEEKEVLKFRAADFYKNPGSLETKTGPLGGRVLRMSPDGSSLYLSGTQRFEKPEEAAPRPFLDRLMIAEGKTERIFQSSPDRFESADLLDDSGLRLMISHEDRTTPRNYDLWEGGSRSRLTRNEDLSPELTQSRYERVQVTRADGFKFFVEVWLPKYALDGYGRPALFWHYPTEFTDQAAYDRDQRSYNKNEFSTPTSSNIRHLNQVGMIAVFPDCPITGPADQANNTFASQLRNNMHAVIEALAARNLIDRRMLAIGGHSYGGFGTANALIHTPFFRAGIAGAGNYNRTLTPFGFQRESRQLWQSPDVYTDISAILHADNMTGALLMYHGQEDQNMGTFPIHSLRMFDVLESMGKAAALYMYPFEDHGQRGLETRLDMWARWTAWLEKHARVSE